METLTVVDIASVAGDIGIIGVLVWIVNSFMVGRIKSAKSEEEQQRRVADVATLAAVAVGGNLTKDLSDAVQKGVRGAVADIAALIDADRERVSDRLTEIEKTLAIMQLKKEADKDRL